MSSDPGVALRKLADRVNKPRKPTPGSAIASTVIRVGTVVGIATRAGRDGLDVVTVSVKGDTLAVQRLDGTTYAVNDLVALAITDTAPLILGRVVGLPNF